MECFIMTGQPQYCSLFSVCRADGPVADGNPYLSSRSPLPCTPHPTTLPTQIGFYITDPVRYEQVIFLPPCLAVSYTFTSVMWARLRSFSMLTLEGIRLGTDFFSLSVDLEWERERKLGERNWDKQTSELVWENIGLLEWQHSLTCWNSYVLCVQYQSSGKKKKSFFFPGDPVIQ